MRKQNQKWNRYTFQFSKYGDGYDVYGWSTYPKNSVLAYQDRKVWLDAFDTKVEVLEAYPEAQLSSQWTEPQVSLNNLPDENDPVPGGMYPDDW